MYVSFHGHMSDNFLYLYYPNTVILSNCEEFADEKLAI